MNLGDRVIDTKNPKTGLITHIFPLRVEIKWHSCVIESIPISRLKRGRYTIQEKS